jgi:hypothetical protein
MDEFTHGGADDGFTVFTVGFEAFAEGANGRVVFPCAECWHIQGFTQGGFAIFGDMGFA